MLSRLPRLGLAATLFPLFSCPRCAVVDHTQPLATMLTLQRAVVSYNWSVASDCFTDDMRRANKVAVESRAFYLTDHWMRSVTIHNFLGPIPILDETAKFVLEEQDGFRPPCRSTTSRQERRTFVCKGSP